MYRRRLLRGQNPRFIKKYSWEKPTPVVSCIFCHLIHLQYHLHFTIKINNLWEFILERLYGILINSEGKLRFETWIYHLLDELLIHIDIQILICIWKKEFIYT